MSNSVALTSEGASRANENPVNGIISFLREKVLEARGKIFCDLAPHWGMSHVENHGFIAISEESYEIETTIQQRAENFKEELSDVEKKVLSLFPTNFVDILTQLVNAIKESKKRLSTQQRKALTFFRNIDKYLEGFQDAISILSEVDFGNLKMEGYYGLKHPDQEDLARSVTDKFYEIQKFIEDLCDNLEKLQDLSSENAISYNESVSKVLDGTSSDTAGLLD